MSTREPVPTAHRALAVLAVMAVIAVLVGIGILLVRYAPGNMGTGFLVGAGVALVAASIGGLRAWTRPDAVGTFTRAFTQMGDERDDAILTRTFGVMGATSVPLTGLAAVVVALGAEVAMVFAVLLFAQVAIGTAAFVGIGRRS